MRKIRPAASALNIQSRPRTEKRPPVYHTRGRKADQSIGLKLNAAPSLMPLGQREVMVLVRV
jgi:hypothetical protein